MEHPRERSWLLISLIVSCCGIEALLLAGDVGLIGTDRLRGLAYEYGGFWPGLLDDWRPNYALQPAAMFLTYTFLHGGLAHLGMNMITLWSLGGAVIMRVGEARFGLLYLASTLGGALGFGLLTDALTPMVGASGALFGLAGALVAWNYADRRRMKQGLRPVLQAIALLIGVNLVMFWVMDGRLAWQTHLGGFVAGWVVALLIEARSGSSGG